MWDAAGCAAPVPAAAAVWCDIAAAVECADAPGWPTSSAKFPCIGQSSTGACSPPTRTNQNASRRPSSWGGRQRRMGVKLPRRTMDAKFASPDQRRGTTALAILPVLRATRACWAARAGTSERTTSRGCQSIPHPRAVHPISRPACLTFSAILKGVLSKTLTREIILRNAGLILTESKIDSVRMIPRAKGIVSSVSLLDTDACQA